MLVADFIADFFHQHGVKHIYEVIGGMITRLVDAVHRQGKIQLISVHHEQAAAFAADATGRLMGIPGIAMATSGPGAINLLTGIGSCYFDSVPAIFITGQVNRNEQRGSRLIRQSGFQETDIVPMAKPITKAAWQINDPEQVPKILQEAFLLATSGRPGPVLLDIPMDVQGAVINDNMSVSLRTETLLTPPVDLIEDILNQLNLAKKPLILVGGGIHAANAIHLLRQFVDIVQVPVVNSLLAVDALPYAHLLRTGLLGTYGNRWVNLAIGRSDLLLVMGSRLDIRQTGADVGAFKGERIIYHVDIEKGEINNRLNGCIPVISHLKSCLTALIENASKNNRIERTDWLAEIQTLRRQWPDTREVQNATGINPNVLMHELSRCSKLASVYAVDVGNHQMWAAQSLKLEPYQRFLTSGGMGAMGFALPAAVGACFVTGKPVIMIAGDGGMQFNIQELQTIAHHKLPVKMVVLNNKSLGMVRQFQQSYFNERYPSTYWGYSAPDFADVANAYKIGSQSVTDYQSLQPALEKMWENPQTPFLLQVFIDISTNVYPKIAFGLPMTEMEPFTKPISFENT
jgi:Thiamine pyrophosphate-requiring enzymes [acetolactate synthase, pyruvate dehydrogenase (cytochrome), glyoxylate carboligase, phosphonopyruvate decarboxylase]